MRSAKESSKKRFQRLLNIGKKIRKENKHIIITPIRIKDLYNIEQKFYIKH